MCMPAKSTIIIWAASWENRLFAYAKTKTQISFAKQISAFVFAIRIAQSLYYLNPKFQASSHILWLYRTVCVGPGQKPRRPVFSQRGSINNQSRTNGPINAHLTIAQVMPRYNHNNEKQEALLQKFRQNICSSTAINSTFNLLILEKQTFLKNSLFTLPRQPIKLRESDKSLITVENYSINISVKIKFYYPQWDSRNFQFPLFPL